VNRRRRMLTSLGPLGLLLSCSQPAPAHRATSTSSASPRADAGSDVTAAVDAATSTEPALESAAAGSSPAAAGPTTTVTVTVPATVARSTTTTTLAPFVVPERVDEDLTDAEWAGRERILACIRSFEGDYGTATGNGHWGAYQFVQSTWDGAAARAGYPQWVGRRASDAPPHVQDDVAWQLYTERGYQPWPPATRYCRGAA
jgi:hypothetical protein